MPRGDRTGPVGAGSMTGRGAGFCSGNDMPGFMNGSFGFGMCGGVMRRRGRMGFGSGWSRPIQSTANGNGLVDRKSFLENRTQALEHELDVLKKSLASLNSDVSE